VISGNQEASETNEIHSLSRALRPFYYLVGQPTASAWPVAGRKLSEATISQGKMPGLFRRWYENGNLAEEIPMRDGKIEGEGHAYHEIGFLKSELTLHDGRVTDSKSWPDGQKSGAQ